MKVTEVSVLNSCVLIRPPRFGSQGQNLYRSVYGESNVPLSFPEVLDFSIESSLKDFSLLAFLEAPQLSQPYCDVGVDDSNPTTADLPITISENTTRLSCQDDPEMESLIRRAVEFAQNQTVVKTSVCVRIQPRWSIK